MSADIWPRLRKLSIDDFALFAMLKSATSPEEHEFSNGIVL
jgi:hypothetical protein